MKATNDCCETSLVAFATYVQALESQNGWHIGPCHYFLAVIPDIVSSFNSGLALGYRQTGRKREQLHRVSR
jgi:hypothetical protein